MTREADKGMSTGEPRPAKNGLSLWSKVQLYSLGTGPRSYRYPYAEGFVRRVKVPGTCNRKFQL